MFFALINAETQRNKFKLCFLTFQFLSHSVHAKICGLKCLSASLRLCVNERHLTVEKS